MALNLFDWLDDATEKVDRSLHFPLFTPGVDISQQSSVFYGQVFPRLAGHYQCASVNGVTFLLWHRRGMQ
ncbi:hypothetical protein ABK730_03525 [Klebsiella indica]|uniref:hypothetical protein n=1 Tax=Klebsiella TaxID=570 RepID=UPI001156FA54|nr:hypothetical protein [Klebsiella sp. 2680]